MYINFDEDRKSLNSFIVKKNKKKKKKNVDLVKLIFMIFLTCTEIKKNDTYNENNLLNSKRNEFIVAGDKQIETIEDCTTALGKTIILGDDTIIRTKDSFNDSNLNLNDILLVKDENSLPKVTFKRRRHVVKRLRMRTKKYRNQFLFKNSREFESHLNIGIVKARRSATTRLKSIKQQKHNESLAKKTKQAHKKFIKKMQDRGFCSTKSDCDFEKFTNLAKNPKTNLITYKSVQQAKTILQSEQEGIISNPKRPNLVDVPYDLDFLVDGPDSITYVNVKRPDISRKFPPEVGTRKTLMRKQLLTKQSNQLAEKLGRHIIKQSSQFPNNDNVLFMVNLELIPPEIKENFSQKVLENAESMINIKFIN